jgi:hypothetical protein
MFGSEYLETPSATECSPPALSTLIEHKFETSGTSPNISGVSAIVNEPSNMQAHTDIACALSELINDYLDASHFSVHCAAAETKPIPIDLRFAEGVIKPGGLDFQGKAMEQDATAAKYRPSALSLTAGNADLSPTWMPRSSNSGSLSSDSAASSPVQGHLPPPHA